MTNFAKVAVLVLTGAVGLTRVGAQSNTPPYFLQTPTNQTLIEFALMTVTNTAASAESNRLTYALLGAPSNASIDTNGVIRWIPNESQGPSTNTFTTVVADDSVPPLTALNSFTVIVLETNSQPFLGFQPNRTISAQTTLLVTNTYFDGDLPTNIISWALLNPPSGAAVDPNSGVISWTPDLSFVGTTNTITTVATDNGLPPLSGTNTFTVFVRGTNKTVLHTNALLAANFNLTAYVQTFLPTINTNLIPAAHVMKVGTPDLIATIGLNRGLGTNIFPKDAKLFLKLPDLSPAAATFVVRYGDVETNIAANLSLFAPSAGLVTTLKSLSSRGTNQVDYLVLEFDLGGSRGSFQVQGVATLKSTSVVDHGKVLRLSPAISGIVATVAGSGRVGSFDAMWRGSVTCTGRKIEIVEGPVE